MAKSAKHVEAVDERFELFEQVELVLLRWSGGDPASDFFAHFLLGARPQVFIPYASSPRRVRRPRRR